MVVGLPPTEKKPSRARLSGGSSSAWVTPVGPRVRMNAASAAAVRSESVARLALFIIGFLLVGPCYGTRPVCGTCGGRQPAGVPWDSPKHVSRGTALECTQG